MVTALDLTDYKATREGYGDALLELGRESENVVVLDGDLSKSTGSWLFGERFPSRFVNCGIAEQNMMGTAAGLAVSGKICFTGSFAVFAAGRAFEQVRNTIAYCKLNVKMCPSHAGVTVGADGGSHQAIEDISLMRSVPNVRVMVPADYFEAKAMVKVAALIDGPVYIRLGRPKVPKIYDDAYRYLSGKADILRTGKDISIFAAGVMVFEALKAAGELAESGIDAEVINVSTIKPLDEETILKSIEKTGHGITAEEHSVIGGLGSAVSELTAEKSPARLARVGIKDRFGTSGEPKELLVHFQISAADIVENANRVLSLKD